MPDEPAPPTEAPTPPLDNPRCRALTVSGQRCKSTCLDGLHLCHTHYNYRHPALPDPKHVVVPFLEDDASITLMLTQVTHGLLSNQLDPVRARTTIYGLQVAALVIANKDRREARAARAAAQAAKTGAPLPAPVPDEQVSRLGYDHEGFISADGDLPEPNPLCPELSAGPVPWDLADQIHPHNQPAPDQRFGDPPSTIEARREEQQKPEDPWNDERLARQREFGRKGQANQYDRPGPGERYYCPSATHGCLGPRYDHCCTSCRRLQNKLDSTERDPTPANLLADDLHAVADDATPYPLPPTPCSQGNTQNTLPSRPHRIKCLQNRPRRGVPLTRYRLPAASPCTPVSCRLNPAYPAISKAMVMPGCERSISTY